MAAKPVCVWIQLPLKGLNVWPAGEKS